MHPQVCDHATDCPNSALTSAEQVMQSTRQVYSDADGNGTVHPRR